LGVNWSKVKKALGYSFSNVVGAICSHRHGDHSKYINNALKDGITVYSNSDVVEMNNGVTLMELGKKTKLGSFIIQPIPMNHDVECYGYLIEDNENGRTLFITDTCDVDYKFKDITNFLVEANYSDEVLIEQFVKSEVKLYARCRIDESHLSLEKAIKFINSSINTNTKTIVLLHLSAGNSDAKTFISDIRNFTGLQNVYVADKDMNLDLNKKGIF